MNYIYFCRSKFQKNTNQFIQLIFQMKQLQLLAVILLFIASGNLTAQTETNVEALMKLSAQFDAQYQAKKAKVEAWAAARGVKIFEDLGDGRSRQIVDIENGNPVYYITHNLGAAHTTRAAELWPGGSTGLNITGQGYVQLGEWDAGKVRSTHQEFTDQGGSRVIIMDGNHALNDHSTHVAGTLVAGGVDPNAKGMGFEGTLKDWEWSNDESEMAAAAANGLELSNHSYGYSRGWDYYGGNWVWRGNSNVSPDEDYKFGFYDSDSRQWDQIAFNAPYYLIVKSAGNDRGEGPGDAGTNGKPEKDGGDDGYDCIGTTAIGKNIMTVGAVREVPDYQNPNDVVMSSFSCWGPADDGRIKPDIVAKGVSVYSSTAGSNSSYSSYDGTSMSSPNATGTMALIQKYYQDTHGGTPMRAATLKGLMLHTADEAGPDPGPDYIFGWGLMNAKRAAQIVTDDEGQNVIDEQVLNGGDIYLRDLNVPEGEPELRVTICWTDPAGTPVSPQLNPRDPMLVNDLDLKILDADGNEYYPWRLDPDNPSAPAVNDGKNYVDNVESVQIENPPAGTYTIMVTHDGPLTGNSQAFSIIISGIDEYTVLPQCATTFSSPGDGAADVLLNEYITWEPADFASGYDVYLGTDGGGTSTPTNFYNGEHFTTNGFSAFLAPSTTYYLQVVPTNNMGSAQGCNTIWSFTTMDAVSEYPYLESVEDVSTPDLPFGWQSDNFSELRWFSTSLIGHTGSKSFAIYNTDGLVETDYDNWLVSPPFRVQDGNEYNASFYFKSFLPGHTETMRVYWGNTPFIEDMPHLLYEAVDFSGGPWQLGEGLIIPGGNDSLVFIGIHMESQAGYGMFLDDVQLENWGTVGVKEPEQKQEVKIFNRNGAIAVAASSEWNGGTVTVFDLTGKIVARQPYNGPVNIALKQNNRGNLYVVNITKGTRSETKKVLIP